MIRTLMIEITFRHSLSPKKEIQDVMIQFYSSFENSQRESSHADSRLVDGCGYFDILQGHSLSLQYIHYFM